MRVLILLGGDGPDPAWLREQAGLADYIIAADRGALCALEAGIVPRELLGDMDSLPGEALARLRQLGVPTERFPAQKDDTDGMLAVERALDLGAESLILAGGFGGRLDHAMANVHLLVHALRRGVSAALMDGRQSVWVTDSVLELRGTPGDILSLLPLGEVWIRSLSGLFYPLADAPLPLDRALGISNVFTAPRARIEVARGIVAAYHLRQD